MNRIEKIVALQKELAAISKTDDLLVVFHHRCTPLQLSVCLKKDSIGMHAVNMITFEYDKQLRLLAEGTKYNPTEVSTILEATKLWLEEEVT